MSAGGSGFRVVIAAMLANLAIAAFKYFAAWMSGSASMLAEGHHSVADTLNQVLLLVGLQGSKRPATEAHPFGYGKVQIFWSFVVALVLFGVAGGLSLKGGIHKILHPEPLGSPLWSYLALTVGILLDGLSTRVVIRELRAKTEPGLSLWQAFRECTDPVIITTFMEDLLALLGLMLALAATVLTQLTGWWALDGWVSVIIGLCLMAFAFVLALELQAMLVGEGLPSRVLSKLRAAVEAEPSVRRLISLRTMVLGSDDVLVGLKVEFDHLLTAGELVERIDHIEDSIRALVPGAHCYVEAGQLKDSLQKR